MDVRGGSARLRTGRPGGLDLTTGPGSHEVLGLPVTEARMDRADRFSRRGVLIGKRRPISTKSVLVLPPTEEIDPPYFSGDYDDDVLLGQVPSDALAAYSGDNAGSVWPRRSSSAGGVSGETAMRRWAPCFAFEAKLLARFGRESGPPLSLELVAKHTDCRQGAPA